ncbi:MAG: ArnT family glycosyltransferase [Afipia sp.]
MPSPRTNNPLAAMAQAPAPSFPDRSLLLKIFVAALAVRWIYALAMYALMGDGGLKGVDSLTYTSVASDFANALRTGMVHGPQWFGDYVYTMPLYHWLSAIPFLIFGNTYGTIAYVLMQGILDAGTCLAVYGIASRISARVALAAALCAILNPTQVVLSGLFYTDTPFIFFVAMAFLAVLRWHEAPSWRNAILLGLFLGCAALIRAIIVPWGFFALVLLAAWVLLRKLALRKVATILAAFLALTTCVGVIVAKNVAVFGTPGLTPQRGIHLALWVVPLAREMQDRTPYMTSYNELEKRTIERFGPHPANPFEQSRQYTIIAKEALKDIPFSAIAKSWLSGMTINLISPGILLSPPVLQLPRPGFYNTPGSSFFDKAYNYVFHSGQPAYTWCLLIGSAGLAVMRILQLVGFIALARRAANWPALFLAASWVGYILLVNGPVASPKYRLPLEPLFNVLSGAGLIAIRDRRLKLASTDNGQIA